MSTLLPEHNFRSFGCLRSLVPDRFKEEGQHCKRCVLDVDEEDQTWPDERKDVIRLLELDTREYDIAHSEADEILLAHVPDPIREAYEKLKSRAPNWATA